MRLTRRESSLIADPVYMVPITFCMPESDRVLNTQKYSIVMLGKGVSSREERSKMGARKYLLSGIKEIRDILNVVVLTPC